LRPYTVVDFEPGPPSSAARTSSSTVKALRESRSSGGDETNEHQQEQQDKNAYNDDDDSNNTTTGGNNNNITMWFHVWDDAKGINIDNLIQYFEYKTSDENLQKAGASFAYGSDSMVLPLLIRAAASDEEE
jgi:hypothetical protein